MRLSFKNKATPENIRVKIVAKSNSSIKIIGDVTAPGNNPTMVLNDGELVFCLAPVMTQGVWVLNPEFNITNGIVTYTAYKYIRSTKYYSHANLSLLEPLNRSFQSEGMQQWQAFIYACNELMGTTEWAVDVLNSQIVSIKPNDPTVVTPTSKFMYRVSGFGSGSSSTCGGAESYLNYSGLQEAIQKQAQCFAQFYGWTVESATIKTQPGENADGLVSIKVIIVGRGEYSANVTKLLNPTYDPNSTDGKTIPFETVSQKIISNSLSTNQGTSSLAKSYLEEVSKSIYTSIQFVTMDDLTPQFEENIIRVSYKGIDQEHVKVNKFTTSALDFEKGLIDKIPNVTWELSGSNTIQNKNVLFSDYSIETKSVGEKLYTNSNIIKGGSEPFSIEFTALLKGNAGGTLASDHFPLISKDNNSGNGDQFLCVNRDLGKKLNLYRDVNAGSSIREVGKININLNEINKYLMTYDGSALRFFVNDKLDLIVGTSNGFNMSTSQPFSFFRNEVPMWEQYNKNTFGLLDNVNIYDGIATQVRESEPFEGNLIVDLSCEGQHNSTNLVDNGTNKNKWTTFGSSALSTNKTFSGFSSLYIPMNGHAITTDPLPISDDETFTMSFSFSIDSFNTSSQFNGIVSNNASNTTQTANRFQICYTTLNSINSIVIGYVGSDGITSIINTIVQGTLLTNKEYRLDLIFQKDKIDVYLNNVLNNSSFILIDNEFSKIFDKGLVLGGFSWYLDVANGLNGYIKNFKIYKGVSVIPENPTGKIQLDFDNNVIDKYNNSSWANSGVTFDQVNSVKGYSAYFNYNNSKLTCDNDTLNLTDSKGYISFDAKIINKNTAAGWDTLITSGVSGSVDRCAIAFSPSNNTLRHRVSSNLYEDSHFNYVTNNYYSINITKKANTSLAIINDCIISGINSNQLNFNSSNQCTIGGALYNPREGFNGYIDNFKSIKDYQGEFIIDKPSVHLPLETNSINTGFSNLTVNSVGNPIYTTIDNKKCIKFESGKYLSINSNNIFNLGTSSDFYIELDFYIPVIHTSGYGHTIINGNGLSNLNSVWLTVTPTIVTGSTTTRSVCLTIRNPIGENYNNFQTTNLIDLGSWNKLKFYRKGNIVYLDLNNIITEFSSFSYHVDFSTVGTFLGSIYNNSTQANFDGYMSNFKMFVGTSVIPETYNDKKVLDLDFKPTRKSYLFKDNNNKCVIHPVNITQRDYQNSQYCCTFNGTNQYLQLGKNELFNFGLDDFVMYFKVNITDLTPLNKDHILISNNVAWTTGYIGLGRYALSNKLNIGAFGTAGFVSTNTFVLGINEIYVIRSGSVLTLSLNGVDTVFNGFTINVNFNANNSTRIGKAWDNSEATYFNGTIHNVKVLRNTSDVTLLEDPWVDPFPEPEVPPFEEGVLNFTELLKDIDPKKVVLDFKQLRYK